MFFDVAYAATAAFDPNAVYDISDIIRVGVALLVLIAGGLSVMFIVWGGVMLILSGGKDEKVKPAINSIRYAVVGVIVIVLAIFVLPRVGDLLGLNVSQYVSPKIVFGTVQELSRRIFGNSSSVQIDGGSNSLPSDFSDL